MSWDKLSMAEKAEVMRLAVQGGIYDLDAIRNGYNEYAKGGKIHIDPSKKGTFTAAASKHGKSVQAFASQVLAHPENYSPAMRKKANFARNAAKWHRLGGNLFDDNSQPTQKMKISKPYYSYDENGRKIDDTLNYNISFPEVVIIPDSRKSPAERAILERERRTNQERATGKGTYDAMLGREWTGLQALAAKKAWEKSAEKKALDYAQAVATGIGIGTDIVSGLPIYSSLKGASVLSRAETPLDYAEGAMWVAPALGGAYQTTKPIVKQATQTAIDNGGFAVSSPRIGKVFGKDVGQFTAWVPFDRSWSEGLSWINTGAPTSEGLPIQYITSKHSGEGRKLYDAVINKAREEGYPGIITGRELISAPKTYRTLEHYYPNRVKLDDMGHWSNDSMTGLFEGPRKTVYSLEDFLQSVQETPNERVHFLGAPRYRLETPSKSVGLAEEDNALINDLLDKFAPKESEGVKAMSIAEREKGYQRMKEFINSPEYQQRLEAAGLGDYKDYMIELIENRLNGKNYFPAWRADKILGKNYRGLSEVNPSSIDYGITVRSDLQGNDFLHTFDHELAHWSTENTPPGLLNNIWYSLYNGKKPNFKVQKIMEANDKIAPVRTWEDYYNSQYGNLSKKELEGLKDEIKKAKKKFKYLSSGQERRARAYAMTQEAKRRGISTDELVDMYTVEDELMGEAPKGLLELNRVYTPENLKKYLRGFLSVATPVTLGLNAYKNE